MVCVYNIDDSVLLVCSYFRFRDCGEDLLMDVSEVLFNELTFFKLMEDFKGCVYMCVLHVCVHVCYMCVLRICVTYVVLAWHCVFSGYVPCSQTPPAQWRFP